MESKKVSLKVIFSFFGALFLIALLLLFLVPNTMVPILIAMALAYGFDPLIDHFELKGFSRTRVVFWFFLLVVFVFLLIVTILLPSFFFQLVSFLKEFPDLALKLLSWVSDKTGLETSNIKDKVVLLIKEQYSSENFGKIAHWIQVSLASTANIVFSVASAMIIPVFFYYFLIDFDRMKDAAFRLIPKPYQSFVNVRLQKTDSILSGFIRGQLMVASILSLLYSLGLMIVGIKYGILIGMVAGILNFVPYLGLALGLGTSLLMAVIGGGGAVPIVGVLLVFGVVQTLEGFVITPKVVGDQVGLSPLASIIALLIGGELFGIAGMLLSIPCGGVFRLLLRDCKAAYLKTSLYRKV